MPGKSKKGGGLESSPVYKKSPLKYGKGRMKLTKSDRRNPNLSIIERVRAGKHKF
mgnify:CR=1 FL=1|jgi:hypothetical protein